MKRNLLLLFVILSTILNAQTIITEQKSANFPNTYSIRNVLNEQNYSELFNQNGTKVFIEQTSEDILPDQLNATLNITLNFDSAMHEAPMFVVVYDEFGYTNFGMLFGATSTSLSVPDGVYDIYAGFTEYTTGNAVIIIKESINTLTTTDVLIDPSEAVNYVSINGYDENNEPLLPGIMNPETNLPTGALFRRNFFFNPTEKALAAQTFMWGNEFSEVPIWNFYVNDISDRYSIIHNLVSIGNVESNHYFTKFQTQDGISESITIENDPSDWILHQENFQSSIISESVSNKFNAFTTAHVFRERYNIGEWIGIMEGSVYSPEQGFRAYLNSVSDEEESDVLVYPGILDYVAMVNPNDGNKPFFLLGNSVVKKGNEIIYGSGAASAYDLGYFLGNKYFFSDDGFQPLPFHSKFSFSTSQTNDIIQGNNSPIASVGFIENSIKLNYIGRYGEKREGDLFQSTVEVRQDNQPIFIGSYLDFLTQPYPSAGEIEITILNQNSMVGEMQGENITKIQFSNMNEDSVPPTLQQLQFRNSEGIVTDNFVSGAEGIVQIAAGDFVYNSVDQWTGYFSHNEGINLELFYSEHSQDEWSELELTEFPAHFHLPGFGNYYETSLSEIVTTEANTWFDVKIICTDAAGNKQEQTISPAFKIEQATMSVGDLSKSNFTYYPNPATDVLNFKSDKQIKSVSVYNLAGQKLISNAKISNNQMNLLSIPTGNYVFRVELENGQIENFKIVKK